MDLRLYTTFADLVRALRRHRHLSQRALAQALGVSSGYVGQWELQLSQPSPDVVVKLCQAFGLDDLEYVQRLVYACRAPEWLRSSIVRYAKSADDAVPLTPCELRMVQVLRQLSPEQQQRLVDRVEGWVAAIVQDR